MKSPINMRVEVELTTETNKDSTIKRRMLISPIPLYYIFLSHTCNERWNQEEQLICSQRHSGFSISVTSQLNQEEIPNDLQRR